RDQDLGVPHRVPRLLPAAARDAAADDEAQFRRLRVRQPDAGAGTLDGLPDRRDQLPHALRAGIIVDQLWPERALRGRVPLDGGEVPAREARRSVEALSGYRRAPRLMPTS